MKFIKKLLGIDKIENKIEENQKEIVELKKLTTSEANEKYKEKILVLTKNPISTSAIAKRLKIGRSYVSKIINKLERQNKVYEHSKIGKTILYKRK